MSEEKVYTFNEYVLGYDSGGDNDRSCLTISKILNDNMYVISTLYDESAEIISTMLDYLQQKVEQLENIRKEAIKLIEEDILGKKIENVNWNYDECDYSDMPVERVKPLLNILNKGDNNVKD